jgi:hypothetical protein
MTTAAPALEGGAAVSGMFGNIMNMIQRGQQTDKLNAAEKKFTSMTPEQLSGLVTRAEQPLGQDLLQNVGNLVQADMGTRGLSQAPGVWAAEETQAIAPYKLQQQQMALQLIMKQLGLPIEYAQAILQSMGGPANIAPLLQLLQQGKGAPNQVPGTPPGGDNIGAIIQNMINSQGPTPPGIVAGGGWTGDASTLPDTGAPA